MRTLLTILTIILLIPVNSTAQIKGDTVSYEELKDLYIDGISERDTAEYHPLVHALKKTEFPGGHKAFIRFINDNIEFPQSMADTIGSEEIFCRIIIDRNGKVTLRSSSKNKNKILSAKVKTLIEALPLFIPGETKQGKADFIVHMTFYFRKDASSLYINNFYSIPIFHTDTP